jgi:lambda family phage portal protein
VESLWKTWADSCACDITGELNFNSMTQLVFRSALENGEAIALPLWIARPDSPFRTCIQLVESDRLRNPWGTENFWGLGPTPSLIAGIEKDDFGRPLAYWIQKNPLYLNGWMLQMPVNAYDFERIPAETSWGRKRVLHMHVKERIGQSRGRPLLTPVIEQLRMLDSYERTELQSAIVNALVAGTIETPLDPSTLAEMMGGDAAKYLEAKNEYRVQLEGGTFIPLYPGDKMQPFMPARPAAQFSAFIEALSRQIGVAMGLPYELLIKDFSKTNYSSARASLMEAWRFFAVRRAWLSSYWAGPVYRLWLEEAINAGMIEAPGYHDSPAMRAYYSKSKWIGMGKGWVDPVKEAEAAQLRMQSMLSTLERECGEQGEDWNDVVEQRALENARLEQLGLQIPAITVIGAKQTDPEGEEPNSAEPEPAPAAPAAPPKKGAPPK